MSTHPEGEAALLPSLLSHLQKHLGFLKQFAPGPKVQKPVKFSQDLDYTHERLYRAICGVIVGTEPFRECLRTR